MFRNHKGVRLHLQTGRIALLFLSALLFTTFAAEAQNTRSKTLKTAPAATVRSVGSEVTLEAISVEMFPGAVRLRWKTGYESNMLGFRLWREADGERVLVGDGLVGASLMTTGDGVLAAGKEYQRYDRTDVEYAYYWIEAVDINQKSQWFGPFYPQLNFSMDDGSDVAADLAALDAAAAERRENESTQRVAVESPALEKTMRSFSTGAITIAPAIALAADTGALKIDIKRKGIYKVSAATLADYGFDPARAAYWRLFDNGVEQPISINSDGSVEFFAVGLDTRQTDCNVYWLITDATLGRRVPKSTQSFVKSAKYGSTRVAVERRDRLYYVTSILNGTRDNFYGAVVNGTAANQTVTITDLAAENTTATIGVDLQGLTTSAHAVTVKLNGNALGTINFSALDRIEWTANVALSRLINGTNTITLQSVNGSSDISVTEAVRITYPRANRARGDRLEFTLPASSQASMIKGFSNAAVRVFDITNPVAVSEISTVSRLDTDGTYMVSINGAPTARQLLAIAGTNQLFGPASVEPNGSSWLRNSSNAAKMIVIAPTEFRNAVQPLVDQRNSEGLATVLVSVEDIFDEFSDGVRSPDAIKSFVQFAKTSWSVKPDYVLLAGDSSNDPRNYLGYGGPTQDRIPVYFVDTWNMETSSDEALVDFNNDGVGELAIGRLPAKNATELQAMVDKILQSPPMSLTELRSRGALFVSDALIGYDFANGSRTMSTYWPSNVPMNFLDVAGRDTLSVRTDILNGFNSGVGVVNYFGHGSVGAWAGAQYFRNVDAVNLSSSGRKPFVAMIDCMNGYFVEGTQTSLAEAVIRQPNGGGSAVWAATGWNSAYEQEFFQRDFYQKAFSGMPLGDAARQAKMLYANLDLRRSYVLFGDPSQPLVR